MMLAKPVIKENPAISANGKWRRPLASAPYGIPEVLAREAVIRQDFLNAFRRCRDIPGREKYATTNDHRQKQKDDNKCCPVHRASVFFLILPPLPCF
jgi:hypothetical protein